MSDDYNFTMGWNTSDVAEVESVTSHLVFQQSADGFAVYVNCVPSRPLTRLYVAIAEGDSQTLSQTAVARDCVRYVAKVLDCAPSWEGCTEDQLVDAVKTYFTRRFSGGVTWRTSRDGKIHLRCDHETSHATVKTLINRLNLAFGVAVTQGWLPGNPMTLVCGPVKSNRSRELDGSDDSFKSGPLPKRKSHLYCVVKGRTYSIRRLIDNDEFPDQLREAADRAQWSQRDRCALELLICGGPRVGEVMDVTFAGLGKLEAENSCALRNKGRGSELDKRIFLSEDARNRLTSYILHERRRFDKRDQQFTLWLDGRTATVPLYLLFLDDQGIDRHSVPIFLNKTGEKYQTKSFERHALYQLRYLDFGLAVSAHHIRYWYVNQFLSQLIADRDLSIDIIIRRADDFVYEMGWSHYDSMRPYDIRGRVISYMEDYSDNNKKRKRRNSINHKTPDVNDEAEYLRALQLGIIPD